MDGPLSIHKGCIIRLDHILKNLRRLFDKYPVVRTEHDALVKNSTKTFSNFVAFSGNPNFKLPQHCEQFFENLVCSFFLILKIDFPSEIRRVKF